MNEDGIDIAANACIEWAGGTFNNGYAQRWVDGKNVYVHRYSWEQANGPTPKGLQIDHLCRNRKCYNIEHLEVVTPGENTRRGVPFRTRGLTHCVHGHEYTPENTLRYSPRYTKQCKICKRAAHNKWRDKSRSSL